MIKVFEIILCILYVFENNIPRCAPMSLLYVLFITDQYQIKYWAGYIGRYMLSLQDNIDFRIPINSTLLYLFCVHMTHQSN